MQTYPLALAASNNFGTRISAYGSQIVFESGTSTGDKHIRVKTDNGDDIELKPGQQVRFTNSVSQWFISSLDGISAITGKLIIGDGDFTDSNISNTFTLDSTFANTVTVSNTTEQRIPVSLGTGPVQTKEVAMEYTNSFSSKAATNAGLQIVAPGANLNGIEVKKVLVTSGGTGIGFLSILAKTSMPANDSDGDLIEVVPVTTSGAAIYRSEPYVKIPAGKGLYAFGSTDTSTGLSKNILYTVL